MHAFNYIVLRVNPGLTSCEDLAIADMHTIIPYQNLVNVLLEFYKYLYCFSTLFYITLQYNSKHIEFN